MAKGRSEKASEKQQTKTQPLPRGRAPGDLTNKQTRHLSSQWVEKARFLRWSGVSQGLGLVDRLSGPGCATHCESVALRHSHPWSSIPMENEVRGLLLGNRGSAS